jgi:hypothetical protein
MNTVVAPDSDLRWLPLHGVVASAKFARIEKDAKDFYVVLGRDASDDDARDEQTDPAEQRMQQREDGSS